ncbi:MAG TPA: MBL fold metallo-hydrolase [Streptosporangiaceae bacterium]|jgi:L-ascorbate metabolism protein UlaG (beta-lactamase superfamily)|nr:MBL fold metallo-hydrolase [Streptosporangiaceae bacterium]
MTAFLPEDGPPRDGIPVELEWFGVSTFRLRVGETVIFLDAYLERVPAAAPVGLASREVTAADAVLVGHSHFDHLHGAQFIAAGTGARIVGSHETVRLMEQAGVPSDQLTAAGGGELIQLGPAVRARVLPSLHSCVWARGTPAGQAPERWLSQQERERRLAASRTGRSGQAPAEVVEHLRDCVNSPHGDGGALGYLLETPAGALYWGDTSGYWTGIVTGMRPDIAILAAAGTGNVDGEPAQGTLADFIADQVALLQPRHLVLCHHDDWMPPVTSPPDLDALRAALAGRAPGVRLHEPGYGQALPLHSILADGGGGSG